MGGNIEQSMEQLKISFSKEFNDLQNKKPKDLVDDLTGGNPKLTELYNKLGEVGTEEAYNVIRKINKIYEQMDNALDSEDKGITPKDLITGSNQHLDNVTDNLDDVKTSHSVEQFTSNEINIVIDEAIEIVDGGLKDFDRAFKNAITNNEKLNIEKNLDGTLIYSEDGVSILSGTKINISEITNGEEYVRIVDSILDSIEQWNLNIRTHKVKSYQSGLVVNGVDVNYQQNVNFYRNKVNDFVKEYNNKFGKQLGKVGDLD